MTFEEHVYEELKGEILRWDESLTKDIYAISFFIYDEDDDPRKPSLTLGYNLNANWRASIPQASSPDEAKWIKSLGFWYTDQDEDENFDRAMELGEKITQEFVELAIGVSQRLHVEGIIEGKFRKDVPILVHELEYYDAIARQNERANPNGSATEFINWIDSGCK